MSGRAAATVDQKIEWLLAHQDVWRGFSSTGAGGPRPRLIIAAMKQAGLFKPSTLWTDIDLARLIGAARLRRAGGQR